MSEDNDDRSQLSLSKPGSKVIRQNLSVGKSKNVAVEIRRKKKSSSGGLGFGKEQTQGGLTSAEMEDRMAAIKKAMEDKAAREKQAKEAPPKPVEERVEERKEEKEPTEYAPRTEGRPEGRPEYRPRTEGRPEYKPRTEGRSEYRPRSESRPDYRPRTEGRPEYKPRSEGSGEYRPRTEGRPDYRPRTDGERPAYRERKEGGYVSREGRPERGPSSQRPPYGGPAGARPPRSGDTRGRFGEGSRPPHREGRESFVPETPISEEEERKRKAELSKKDREKRSKKFSDGASETKKEQFDKRQSKRVDISRYRDISHLDDVDESGRAWLKKRLKKKEEISEGGFIAREVIIPKTMTVAELANRMAVRSADLIKKLMQQGMFVTVNQVIDADIAELMCIEFGHTPKRVSEEDVEKVLKQDVKTEDLIERAPVVTVMGHVDHGKTSLLDALRKTSVVKGEAGGITQHIGAYRVFAKNKKPIVFIDTPGHAAFSEMRARGANITDIVILVVAGDDGVKAQTVEAIQHAKAAKVPMIVAVNKMDLPGADSSRVCSELLGYEIVPETMGGDVMVVEISAKTGMGLEKLEDDILLLAETLELKEDPKLKAEGVVVEATQEKGRGSVATILVQRGTLNVGDVFVVGKTYGKVKLMLDEFNQEVKVAGPSTPVRVLGLDTVPQAGDAFHVVEDEQTAISIAESRARREKEEIEAKKIKTGGLAGFLQNVADSEMKVLPVIVKGDVHGSVEAIKGSLEKLSDEHVKVNILQSAVGPISENDVSLAKASSAVIIAFNVRANAKARDIAKQDNVEILYHSIIYKVIEDVQGMMKGFLSPVFRDKFIGYAEIRQVFNITKFGKIAGCMVTEGMVQRGAKVRLLRDNVVIHEGKLKTLKRFKDEVKEVKHGYECGMAFENYDDIKVGDIIECSVEEEVAVA